MSNIATATKFQITSTKLYIPVVTLPTKKSYLKELKDQYFGMNIKLKLKHMNYTIKILKEFHWIVVLKE